MLNRSREYWVRIFGPSWGYNISSCPAGDDPPRDRTSELRVLGFPGRHLGPVQMTTDTALGVTKIVVQDKSKIFTTRPVVSPADDSGIAPLSKISFVVSATVRCSSVLSR